MMLIRKLISHLLLTLMSAAAVAAGEPWSEEFVTPPGPYSWVQLVTGEWLKGEIISMYDDSLNFDSDHFNRLSLDLEDIQRIHGHGIFEMTFQDGVAVHGQLQLLGQQLVVARSDGNLKFGRQELVSITPSVERERDRWTGDISAGFNARQGNTDVTEFDLTASLQRRTPVSRMTLDYRGESNDTEGVRITDSHRVNLAVDRFTGRRLYWRPIALQYYKDELQNIRNQSTADTGLGYHLSDTDRVDWELQAGVGVNYLSHVSVSPGEPDKEWSPVGTFGSDLYVDATSWMEYEFLVSMTFLEKAAGRYQDHIVNTLSTDLIAGIDLDVSLIWDRTENPQAAEDGTIPEQDDYRLVVSFSYDF